MTKKPREKKSKARKSRECSKSLDTNKDLDAIEKSISPFQAAENKALALISEDKFYYKEMKALYFGMCGIGFAKDSYNVSTKDGKIIAYVRKIEGEFGEVALAGALKNPSLFGVIGRYARVVTHELALPIVEGIKLQKIVDLAYQLIACIRVAGAAEAIIPAFLDRSWSVLPSIKDQSCTAHILEDFPMAKRFRNPLPIDDKDITWIGENFDNFQSLMKNRAFALAVDCYNTYGHAHNLRLMAATLWSGIEALLGIRMELRYRLSLYVAVLTEDAGPKRIETYRKVLKLYDFRSKIVHGVDVKEKDISEHILEVSLLLGHILYVLITNNRLPTSDQLDEMMLSVDVLKLSLEFPLKNIEPADDD